MVRKRPTFQATFWRTFQPTCKTAYIPPYSTRQVNIPSPTLTVQPSFSPYRVARWMDSMSGEPTPAVILPDTREGCPSVPIRMSKKREQERGSIPNHGRPCCYPPVPRTITQSRACHTHVHGLLGKPMTGTLKAVPFISYASPMFMFISKELWVR